MGSIENPELEIKIALDHVAMVTARVQAALATLFALLAVALLLLLNIDTKEPVEIPVLEVKAPWLAATQATVLLAAGAYLLAASFNAYRRLLTARFGELVHISGDLPIHLMPPSLHGFAVRAGRVAPAGVALHGLSVVGSLAVPAILLAAQGALVLQEPCSTTLWVATSVCVLLVILGCFVFFSSMTPHDPETAASALERFDGE